MCFLYISCFPSPPLPLATYPFPLLLFIPSLSLDIASTLPVPHHHYCMMPYRTIIARRSCDLMTVVLIPYLLDYYSYSIYTGSGHQEILWV